MIALIVLLAAQEKKAVYYLPFEEGKSYDLSQGNNSKGSHSGSQRYAFDFAMPVGTKVSAARAGKVVDVKKDFSEGGLNAALMNKANMVVVDHGDGTIARYLHLKKDGALVAVGESVLPGDVIALSGATGYVTGPHLHFVVCRTGTWDSLPCKFEDVDVNGGVPLEGKTYKSKNTPLVPPAARELSASLAKEAKTALDLEAFGLAYAKYRTLSLIKLPVKYPPVEDAKEKTVLIETKVEDLLKEAASLPVDAAAEKLLLAKNSFKGVPSAPKIAPALAQLRKKDGYGSAEKALDKIVFAQDQLLRALGMELDGSLKGALYAYQDCARIDPAIKYSKIAEERAKVVRARLEELAPRK